MGSFKEKNREGVSEIRENSKETTDLGSEMNEKAEQIKSVLESIELLDEEDAQAISETGRSYQGSFDSAFGEKVETAEQEIEQQGEQVRESTESELENVHFGIEKLEQVEDVSEIGHDAAEAGRSTLEGSAGEYEEMISEAEDVVNETKQQVASLRSNLSGIFG
jgi:hypothetical protein